MQKTFQLHTVFKDNITSRPGAESEIMPKKPTTKKTKNTTNWTSWLMDVKKVLFKRTYDFEQNSKYEEELYDRWRIGDDIEQAVAYIYTVKTNEKRKKRKRTR